LNETSYYLLNKDSFSLMKKRPYIINTARGGMIKEDDLILALELGQIRGAGLDVFEMEPLPLNSPLRKSDKVTLSSHNSNSSAYFWDKVHQNSVEMLAKGLSLE
jgi:D-3-phosphoglycerate dehydrogenase